MFSSVSRVVALAICGLALSDASALAHCFVGARFFPATLAIDDPCVADELSIPTVAWSRTSDQPSAQQLDVSGEFSKRITETFGVSISPTWTRLSQPGSPSVSGFQDLETTFKWQFLSVPNAEFVMSTALVIDWGGTGANSVGADTFTTYTPTFYMGKGFGTLPDDMGWARPFGFTAQVGYAIPSSSSTMSVDDSGNVRVTPNPRFLTYGFSLQYSMPYLKSNVVDLQLPDIVNHLIPIVEARLQTPVSNSFGTGIGTSGTINPGVIWVGDYFQVGLEAMIPINHASGSGTGVIGQLHLYLDDMFPTTIGQPLIGGVTNPRRPMFGN
ncbi:MAG TPA: hypothetical protein VKX28_08065 [Xanthobacteraceae bacterium]|nr:hypothetical protein [Xanthobacteraceae bacterium]